MAKANRLGFSARSVTAPVPESDTDSDSEPEEELEIHVGAAHLPTKQVIHSGHFMVSAPHCDSGSRRKRRSDSTTLVCHEGAKSDAGLTTDPTLTRLFECMTLVYSGKIVSPKWKSFKGLCLLWRDKIRLNNGIWRAWYIQSYTTNADIIQPGLTPLQPNVDEFVDISGCKIVFGLSAASLFLAEELDQLHTYSAYLHFFIPLRQENVNTDGMSHSRYHRGPLSPEISYEREDVNTEFKYKSATHYKHLYDFHPMGVLPESPLYGHQQSKSANNAVQSTSNVADACFSSYSDLFPKYRCSSGVTSSVITYTGTTSAPTPWTSHQLVSSSHNFGVFPPMTLSSMSLSEPSVSAGTPSNQGTCRFSVPERRSPASGVKCKQTIQTGKSEYVLSPSIMVQGSCLAKLLSEDVQEKLPSPQGQHGFLSLNKAQHIKGDSRRITHISAEQKRRFNIKIGFDTLQGLVSTLSSPSSIKISKAAILNKTAEYIAKMQQERTQIQEEAQHLRNEIVKLNSAIKWVYVNLSVGA
ncbi:MLXPL protein, partial [Polypterus senegalus]